jgi:hypothetical protein
MDNRNGKDSNSDKNKGIPSKVAVTAEVWQGINAVRCSGLTNMLDRPMVAELAGKFGFTKAAQWVKNHPKEYAEGVGAFRWIRRNKASHCQAPPSSPSSLRKAPCILKS